MIPGSVSLLVLSPLDILAMASLAGSAVPPYVIRALVLVVVLGIACAPVGALVNLRSAEFSAEALVHAVFPGIVIGAVVWGAVGDRPCRVGGGGRGSCRARALGQVGSPRFLGGGDRCGPHRLLLRRAGDPVG